MIQTINRSRYLQQLSMTLAENPVAAVLGPRQCGKTTLALQYATGRDPTHYFDLETAAGRARLAEPELALRDLRGLIVIDEFQRAPDLFETLRPMADRPDRPAQFLILGSASADLARGASESLAGRIGFVDLTGFNMQETGAGEWRRLWLRGGFPRSYLAPGEAASLRWRRNYIRTFLERDIPQLGIRIPAVTLRRFWMMVAHFHGQIWNAAELARSIGVSESSARHYLDLLTGAYILRQLPPWFANIAKRQYRAPKVYVRDSGLLHALLTLAAMGDLESHPKLGASWEGFALEQVLSITGDDNAFFWGTHAGAEIDLLLLRGGRTYGVEFERADAPRMTKSLHLALTDLKLERAWIVYPGEESYPVHPQVDVIPITHIPAAFAELT